MLRFYPVAGMLLLVLPALGRAQTPEIELELRVLNRSGPAPETPGNLSTIPAAVAALQSKDAEVRRLVVMDLDRLLRTAHADDPDAAKAVTALINCLTRDDNAEVRLTAIRTLGHVGAAARSALP